METEAKAFEVFGKVLRTNKPKVSFIIMNELTIKQGIFVPEELCYLWLYDYLKDNQINPNSTFYQKWEEVTSKTRWQIWLHQMAHYASTYGTNFQREAWLPERSNLPDFPYKDLKVLEGIEEEELCEKMISLAYSNIAMNSETLEFLSENKHLFEFDKIKNRTLKLMCIPEDYQFKNGQECLNWILWKYCHIDMLVKNAEILTTIKAKNSSEMLVPLEKNKEVLASVFYRNKDVFMQFKNCKKLCHIVNVIRKLATKLHKPMKKSPWLQLEDLSFAEREKLFESASIFKLVQIYNVLEGYSGYYIIRNGKAYYREEKAIYKAPSKELKSQLLKAIVDKVPNVESVTLPEGIELAMPTSEKNFIGEIPLGSYIKCSEKNTMIGIYWKNKWGARDLDLHVRTIEGNSLGWNASHNNDGEIIFSGDMTNADPEAAEIMWFKKKPIDSIVSVSEYNGNSYYHYEMFVAQENATDFRKGYMVDPRNIVYKAEINSENKRDITLGFFRDGNFVFHSCNIGNGIVPGKYRDMILRHLVNCNYLTVREVLELSGINITDDSEVKLTSKGDLINFFSGSTK